MSRITDLMKALNCSAQEAQEILDADKAIDSGERVSFDLPIAEEKQAKKYANVTTHNRKNNVPHERKPDEGKERIVAAIADLLPGIGAELVHIKNRNRLIGFTMDGRNFELTLVAKRIK